jgi:hypothetical protein
MLRPPLVTGILGDGIRCASGRTNGTGRGLVTTFTPFETLAPQVLETAFAWKPPP